MPRLPTLDSLGERPVPTPDTSIQSIRTGAEARAMVELGQTIGEIEQRLTHAREGAQLSEAIGQATEQLGTKAIDYAHDQDFKTAPARFKADADSIGKNISDGIDNKRVRAAFLQHYSRTAALHQVEVYKGAAKEEGDQVVAKMDQTLTSISHLVANASTPELRDQYMSDAENSIKAAVAGGWMSHVNGQGRLKKFGNEVSFADAKRDINDNPDLAQKWLTDPKYLPDLSEGQRQDLVHISGIRSAQLDRQAKQANADILNKQANDLSIKFVKGTLSATDLLDPNIDPNLRISFAKDLRAQAKGQVSEDRKGAMVDLLRRINLPWGDANKISTMDPITQALINKDISPGSGSYEFLQRQLYAQNDATGRKLGPDINTAINKATDHFKRDYSTIADPNVLTGAVTRFSDDLRKNAADRMEQGKDPRDLLTPGKPEFMLSPEKLASYLPTRKQALSQGAAAIISAAPKNKDGTVDSAQMLKDAKEALARGAPRAIVEARLKAVGLSLEAAPVETIELPLVAAP